MNIYVIVLLFGGVCQVEHEWEVEKSTINIVMDLKDNFGSAGEGPAISPEIRQYVPKLFLIDAEFIFTARPYHHYYVFESSLKQGYGKLWHLEKKLEIWAVGDKTVFRSTASVGFGRNLPGCLEKIKNKVIFGILHRALLFEEKSIAKIAE